MRSQVVYQAAQMQHSVVVTECATYGLAKKKSLSGNNNHALPVWCAINADITVWLTRFWVRHHGRHAGQIALDQSY